MSLTLPKKVPERIRTKNLALQAYLIGESDGFMWLQDQEGTLKVRRRDVLATSDWDNSEPDIGGIPIKIYMRDDAELIFGIA